MLLGCYKYCYRYKLYCLCKYVFLIVICYMIDFFQFFFDIIIDMGVQIVVYQVELGEVEVFYVFQGFQQFGCYGVYYLGVSSGLQVVDVVSFWRLVNYYNVVVIFVMKM